MTLSGYDLWLQSGYCDVDDPAPEDPCPDCGEQMPLCSETGDRVCPEHFDSSAMRHHGHGGEMLWDGDETAGELVCVICLIESEGLGLALDFDDWSKP